MNNSSFEKNKTNTRKYKYAQQRFDMSKENVEHEHEIIQSEHKQTQKMLRETRILLMISFASIFFSLFALTGTTYAWFTASVSNVNNRIQAGTWGIGVFATKNVEKSPIIDLTDDENAAVFEVESLTPEAPTEAILTIRNKGTIGLKYALFFDITKDYNPNTGSVETKLSNKLKVYVRKYVENDTNPPSEIDYVGTMANFASTNGFLSNNNLSAGNYDKYRVWICLDGNEADYTTYTGQEISFGIRIDAGQINEPSNLTDSNQ